MRRLTVLTASIFVTIFLFTFAYAEDNGKSDDWEFNVTPFYLWAVSMDGTLTVQGNEAPVDVDFDTITDSLEKIFTLHAEGMHKSGWGVLVDISYLTVGGKQKTAGPTMDVDFTSVMSEFAAIYRYRLGNNSLDLIGGIRYYDLELEIDFVGGSLPGIDKDQDWVDAMFGVRYDWNINDKWKLMTRGDIGGGGSDLAYNLEGLFEYKPWEHVSFVFGYRYMSIDYDDGSGSSLFEYDVDMYGPLLGLNFVW